VWCGHCRQLLGGLELRLGNLEDAKFSSVLARTSHVLAGNVSHLMPPGASENRDRDDRLSVGGDEVSGRSSVRSRGSSRGSSMGNPLHAQMGMPLLGVGLPQMYLEKSGEVSETVTSLDVDEDSSLTGGDEEEEEEEEGSLEDQENLSLSALDLSELEGE